MSNFKILNTCMINVHVLYSMFLERKKYERSIYPNEVPHNQTVSALISCIYIAESVKCYKNK